MTVSTTGKPGSSAFQITIIHTIAKMIQIYEKENIVTVKYFLRLSNSPATAKLFMSFHKLTMVISKAAITEKAKRVSGQRK